MSTNLKYRTFAHPPDTKPFKPTGSYDLRHGVINVDSMTLKQRRFEQFANEMQKRHDERSELREWRRRRDLEEEAIDLYHELGKDLTDFSIKMRTRDQEDMEFQCQRKKQKAEDLDPCQAAGKAAQIPYVMWCERQKRIKAQEAEERAKDAERMRTKAVEDLKAAVQASSHPLATKRTVTNAAGSQEAREKSELTSSKPKEQVNTSQPISSPGVGSSRQQEQEQKQKLSPEEIRCQFQDQIQDRARLLPATESQSMSSAEAGSSRQQEQKMKPNAKKGWRPFQNQFGYEVEIRRSARNTSTLTPLIGTTVPSIPSGAVVSAPAETLATELNPAVIAVTEDLAELHLRSPSEAEQSLPCHIGKQSVSSQEHLATGSSDQRSTSPSSQQAPSDRHTPPSSVRSSSPKTTPAETSPNTPETPAENLTNNKDDAQNEETAQIPEINNAILLAELERLCYGDNVTPINFAARLSPAKLRNPLLKSILLEHLERVKAKKDAAAALAATMYRVWNADGKKAVRVSAAPVDDDDDDGESLDDLVQDIPGARRVDVFMSGALQSDIGSGDEQNDGAGWSSPPAPASGE